MRALAAIAAVSVGVAAQEDPIDLLADARFRSSHRVSLYVPKVPPQVRCIRSDEQATAFCEAAWGQDKEELHVDFEHEQVLVVAWGALGFRNDSNGALTDVRLERVVRVGETLRVEVRTVIAPGTGIDVDLERAHRTWYPSMFVRLPRTERVEVDVVGSRRRDRTRDLQPVATRELEVRIGPDDTPSREKMTLLGLSEQTETPHVKLTEVDGRKVLDVAWGEFGPGSYRVELIRALVDDGVAHLTIRADNHEIVIYSGPGVHYPGLRVALPDVEEVRLKIERVGLPLGKGQADFEPLEADGMVVTVDRSRVWQQER